MLHVSWVIRMPQWNWDEGQRDLVVKGLEHGIRQELSFQAISGDYNSYYEGYCAGCFPEL
jgi:hypothetical protein